jgi:hypothetical protein
MYRMRLSSIINYDSNFETERDVVIIFLRYPVQLPYYYLLRVDAQRPSFYYARKSSQNPIAFEFVENKKCIMLLLH